jgi:hypothetical protein
VHAGAEPEPINDTPIEEEHEEEKVDESTPAKPVPINDVPVDEVLDAEEQALREYAMDPEHVLSVDIPELHPDVLKAEGIAFAPQTKAERKAAAKAARG